MISNKHFKYEGNIVVEYVTLHKISQSTIDPVITFTRVGSSIKHTAHVPPAVGRTLYNTANKITNFLVGYPACLVWVGDMLVCAIGPTKQEILHMNTTPGFEWKSTIETNVAMLKHTLSVWGDVMFDGQYLYNFTSAPETLDGNFGFCRADTLNLYHLHRTVFVTKTRAGFAYKTELGEWVVTPPVTAVSPSGAIQLVGDVEDSDTGSGAVYTSFQSIDIARFVNLRFVNFAAKRLVESFDYPTIEPLGIPLLMIEHSTFNLGDMTTVVQQVSEAPLKYTCALAWLIGLHQRIETIDQLSTVKQCIKMLLTKGCTRSVTEKAEDGTTIVMSKHESIHNLREMLQNIPSISLV